MKKVLLITIVTVFGMLNISLAQEWDDPVTTSDWDQLWKSSFVQGNSALNGPESSGWFWGINLNHSSNSSSYRYNGQIAIKNDHDAPTMYFRSTNQNGSGVWSKVVNSYSNSYVGNLTTINSLRINGNNLHNKNLTFLNNSASALVGWNRSGSHGETSFISNRGSGSLGGFDFRDIDNSGIEKVLLKLTGNGNIGINNNSPSAKLDIVDDFTLLNSNSTIDANLVIRGVSSNRSINEGASIGFVLPANTNGTNYWQQGRIIVTPDNANNANAAGRMFLQTRSFGGGSWNWVSNMVLRSNGNVGIGTTNPDSKLTVNGAVHSQEVLVDVDAGTGPDYVFEEDYNLISLEETKAYIETNKHLPEVPSDKVMESEGLELRNMSLLLLKKIEEMTLHQIELMETVKNQNEKLTAQNSNMIEQNAKIENQNTKIELLQKEIEALKNK